MRSRSSSLNVRTAGQLEVVVEAVLDGRPDGELRAREQAGHRLGQHVGRRVAQHVTALVGAGGDDRDDGAIGERRGQVGLDAVDDCGDRRLLQAGADGSGEVERRGIVGQFAFGTVGEGDRDVRHATVEDTSRGRRPLGGFPVTVDVQLPATRASSCSPHVRRDRELSEIGSATDDTRPATVGSVSALAPA